MISCNIWLPVVIHRSKTRNNALDVFWGIETIIMPLSRQPQKKSFCPVSHSLAPTFMKIFFIMRLPCRGGLSLSRTENYNINERLVCKKGTDLDFKQNDKLSFGKKETPFKRM